MNCLSQKFGLIVDQFVLYAPTVNRLTMHNVLIIMILISRCSVQSRSHIIN